MPAPVVFTAYRFTGDVLLYLPEGREPNATDGPAIEHFLRSIAV